MAQTMDTGLDDYKAALRRRGLKATPQRVAVHMAMMDLRHASADMVCGYLRSHGGSKATAASVYNILEQMSRIGIYRRRLSANSKMYFDVEAFPHLHLYDSVNHEYRNIQDDRLMEMVEAHFKKRRFRGYRLEGIDIQIICTPTKRKDNL